MTYFSPPAGRVVDAAAPAGRDSRFVSYRTVGLFTAAADYLIVVMASVLAGIAYHALVLDSFADIGALAAIGNNSALVFVLLSKARGLYRTPALLSIATQLQGVIFAWIVVLLVITSLLFLLKIGGSYSRGSTIGFGFLGLALLLGWRAVFAFKLGEAIARGTLSGPRAVTIGDQQELQGSSAIQLIQSYGVREVARFELPAGAGDDAALAARDAAVVDAAIKAAQATRAEEVLLALRWTDSRRRDLVCERLRALPLPVFLLPDRSVASVLSQPTLEMGSQLAVELQRAPMSRMELAKKRALDVVLAAAALVVLSPLFALVSMAIKLASRGPVIFCQRRYGFNGGEFTIYKFRTMTVMEDGTAIRQAQRGDERVTRLGRVLRTTSIDELPQLINVLRGDMSLVGPRPHAVAHGDEYAELIANYAFRHHVKPGITGWAQVNGFRGETERLELMKQRIDLDLWYINNWGMWLDLQIVLRTCFELVRRQNAY